MNIQDLYQSMGYFMGVPLFLVCALVVSNIFMVIAWYAHLRHKHVGIRKIIFISWGIALFEYIFHVTGSRLAYGEVTLPQLKILQELVSLCAFVVFARLYLKEKMHPQQALGFVLVIASVVFIYSGA